MRKPKVGWFKSIQGWRKQRELELKGLILIQITCRLYMSKMFKTGGKTIFNPKMPVKLLPFSE